MVRTFPHPLPGIGNPIVKLDQEIEIVETVNSENLGQGNQTNICTILHMVGLWQVFNIILDRKSGKLKLSENQPCTFHLG